jgi:hypothetical protein
VQIASFARGGIEEKIREVASLVVVGFEAHIYADWRLVGIVILVTCSVGKIRRLSVIGT